MRMLVLQTAAQWTGSISGQAYLELPIGLDIDAEETAWFTSGGGTLRDFVAHLVARGAREILAVETWTIRYQ